MLRKLLKYEIKATARAFLPLYLALLVFAVINNIIPSVSSDEWSVSVLISRTLYGFILIGLSVVTYVVMIRRFYKNLLSDEGYLMFTLPVQVWKLILSKLLVSMMWIIASFIIALISIIIFAMNETPFTQILHLLVDVWQDFCSYLGNEIYLVIFELALSVIVNLIFGVLIIYASIAMGHLSNRHKILASIGSFLALTTISQVALSTVFSMTFLISPEKINTMEPTVSFFRPIIWLAIIITAALSAGYFAVTNTILKRRLNLE